jgi:hypothetical protein
MTLVNRRVLEDIALLLTASLAMLWTVLRAAVQSIPSMKPIHIVFSQRGRSTSSGDPPPTITS